MSDMWYNEVAETKHGAFCFPTSAGQQPHITRYGQSAPYVSDVPRPAVRLSNDRQIHRGRFDMGTSITSYLKPVQQKRQKLTSPQGISKYILSQISDRITWEALVQSLTEPRSRILELTHFDILCSPRFAEHLVSSLCGLNITAPTEKWDAETDCGMKIEVKLANSTWRATSASQGYLRFFKWQRFHGQTQKGKPADTYILVGYDHDVGGFGGLRFYVIPSCILIQQASITIPLGQCSSKKKWEQFRINPELLNAALAIALEYQANYIKSGWQNLMRVDVDNG